MTRRPGTHTVREDGTFGTDTDLRRSRVGVSPTTFRNDEREINNPYNERDLLKGLECSRVTGAPLYSVETTGTTSDTGLRVRESTHGE